MSDIVIKAENLGKKYTIGHKAENGRYTALRDVMMQNARSLWHKTRDLVQGKPIIQGDDLEEVWALKDVSFKIRRGEAVGIIGRNGAGKSTLLKVLSRITEPSAGRATIKGRVASLLEVGTGFHSELNGRENIYLNGAILGMTRQEIKRKFDEIVAFAEIEKFLDTPVKRYSSGMYVRLAFAVAAHLEPEILLIDEVLAVGDAAFQKKCLGKMGDVAKEGRTVLFVSHNMGAVRSLCNCAYWLESGVLMKDGPVESTIQEYLRFLKGLSIQNGLEKRPRLRGGIDLRLTRLDVLDDRLHSCQYFSYGTPMILRFHYRLLNPTRRFFAIEVVIRTLMGENVLYVSSSPQQQFLVAPAGDTGCVQCRIDRLPLTSGGYTIYCRIVIPHHEYLDEVDDAVRFEVVDCDVYRTGFNLSSQVALATTESSWSIIEGARQLLKDAGV